MQHKHLDEDASAVGSAYGSQDKIPEDSDDDKSDEAPDLILNISPFNISNLRDSRGKKFKVIFRDTGDYVQIEIHKFGTALSNPSDVVNYRILEKTLMNTELNEKESQDKWVNAGMRCLCQNSNNNYSLSEVEKFLDCQAFDKIIDF